MKTYQGIIAGLLLWIVIWWMTFWSTKKSSPEDVTSTNLANYKTFPSLAKETSLEKATKNQQAPITEQWKIIINQMRSSQTPTDLFKEEQNDEWLCAWYVYELSRSLWWDNIVNTIWLHHPKTRTACDARELPYCYWYQWGIVHYDIWEAHWKVLKKDPNTYHKIVNHEEIIRLFSEAFSYKSFFGDLTFLYNQSAYLHMIWSYGNYNSHIWKNMWLSTFKTVIKHPETPHISNDLLLRNALWCNHEMRTLLSPVRSRYEFMINWNKAIYTIEKELFIQTGQKRKPYTLQTLDEITYTDVTVAHFWEGEKVDSYFQLSCQGEFSPIAVVEINEKFIEKG